MASQDWPEVTKYAGLVSAQAHRQELIEDLYKVCQDPQRGTVSGGMIRCTAYYFNFFLSSMAINLLHHEITGSYLYPSKDQPGRSPSE